MATENRAQLMALIATNFFGQNTPAIAATEAQYMEMWAQDATAMYGYAAAYETTSTMTPFDEPPQTTNSAGQGAQAQTVVQTTGNATSAHTQSLAQLSSPAAQQATTVGPVAPGQTVTLAPGSTIDIGTNTGVYVNSGSITITGAGTNVVSYGGSVIVNPGSTIHTIIDCSEGGVLIPGGVNVTAGSSPIILTPGSFQEVLVSLVDGSATLPVVGAGTGRRPNHREHCHRYRRPRRRVHHQRFRHRHRRHGHPHPQLAGRIGGRGRRAGLAWPGGYRRNSASAQCGWAVGIGSNRFWGRVRVSKSR